MTTQPLLVLSEQRIQQEVRRAIAATADTRYDTRRTRLIVAACTLEFLAGQALMVLGYHVTGEDFGQALFLAGLMVGYLGPAWTCILVNWRGAD